MAAESFLELGGCRGWLEGGCRKLSGDGRLPNICRTLPRSCCLLPSLHSRQWLESYLSLSFFQKILPPSCRQWGESGLLAGKVACEVREDQQAAAIGNRSSLNAFTKTLKGSGSQSRQGPSAQSSFQPSRARSSITQARHASNAQRGRSRTHERSTGSRSVPSATATSASKTTA